MNTVAFRRAATLTGLATALLACTAEAPAPGAAAGYATQQGALGSSGVVVNEFRPGKTGWVELYNTSSKAQDISGFLAMNFGYNAMPKSYVVPDGTTIGPKARLTVPLVIRSTVPDGVHLLDHKGLYGAVDNEQDVTGLYKLPSGSTKCFARQPDGGAWAAGPVTCSKDAANAGAGTCKVGSACDDGNPCSEGEVWSASCTCGGGKLKVCDDGNACTSDACIGGACKNTASYLASPCGNGGTCKLGVCSAGGTAPGTCTDKGGTIEGVAFTAAQACKAVAFLNGAKFSELEPMGDHARVVIYDSGPGGYTPYHTGSWSQVAQFGNVNLIGPTALKQLLALSQAWTPGGLWYDTVKAAYASKAAGLHFSFEKVVVTKLVGSDCYEIRDSATATNWLTACKANCYNDGCSPALPPVGSAIWVRGRLEFSGAKAMLQAAVWKAANPKL